MSASHLLSAATNRSLPFFEGDYFHHDLRRGTLFNRAGTKMCYLPSELIQSLKEVLEEETGEAWSGILHRVGRIWGRRVARRFEGELEQFYHRSLHEMPMPEFVAIVEGYFRYHGWGRLRLDFTHADMGVVEASLDNGAFVELLGRSGQPVDSIVCGLLGEFFCQVADRNDLECIETECRACGAPRCRFVVTTSARLGPVRKALESFRGHEFVLEQLVGTSTRHANGIAVGPESSNWGLIP